MLSPFETAYFWIINLESITSQEVDYAFSILDDVIIKKNDLIKNPDHRRKSLIVHAIVRLILKEITGLDSINIQYSKYRKPFLLDYPVHFNLSHSQDWAFFGVHPQTEIGVDIEAIQPCFNYLEIAKYFLFPNERKYIVEAFDPVGCFFSMWCAKEAFLKAKGTGFLIDKLPCLSEFESNTKTSIYFVDQNKMCVYHEKLPGYKLAVCVFS